MATGATGQLGLALPVQGELSGTWGDTVNNGITQYTNIAIAGTLTLTNDGAVTLANTTGDASASNIVSTLTGAGTITAQFAIVKVTGTLTTPKIITAPSYSKTYVVVNAATGSTVSFIRSGQTPAVSIAVGETAFVYYNGTDYVKITGTATAGAAGGSNTQVQFNSSGALAGSANMTFNGTTLTVNDFTDSSLTAGRVTYAGTAGNLVDSANLTFNGTILTAAGFSGPLNGTVGATTANTGAFTTLSASGTTTLSGNQIISVTDNTNAALRVTQLGTGNALLVEDSTNPDSSPFVINATGVVSTGFTSNPATMFGTTPQLGVHTTGNDGIANYRAGNDVNGSAFVFQKTRGADPSVNTIVQSGDTLGAIYWTGADGTSYLRAAQISGQVDSPAPGTGDMPGRLVFSTTADGASTPTERLRIASTGAFGLSGANYGTSGQVLTSGGSAAAPTWTTVSSGASAATPTALGTVYGKQTASGASPYLTAYGYDAAPSITGVGNVAVGYQAGYAITSGTQNIAIGYNAFNTGNGSGGANTVVGTTAGQNISGALNTAVGANSMRQQGSGSNNTAIGYGAMGLQNSPTIYNFSGATAVGKDALGFQQAGPNDAFGVQALYSTTTGIFNVAVGYEALKFNTTANQNTAMGYQAGYTNTTGSNLSAFGLQAGYGNTTGGENTFIGANAARTNTTGNYGVSVGGSALFSNTTGGSNIAIGYQALYSNTTGSTNTAIGHIAGYGLRTSGGNVPGQNIAIGNETLYTASYASGHIAIGYQAFRGAGDAGSNGIAIGYQAGRNCASIGNSLFIGYQAAYTSTYWIGGICIGTNAGYSYNDPGTPYPGNFFVGDGAGRSVTTGTGNVMLGAGESGFSGGPGRNTTTGSQNTVLGTGALTQNTTQSNQCAIGYATISQATGEGNTACGSYAGSYNFGSGNATTSGTRNTFLGSYTIANAVTDSNCIVIGSALTGKGGSTGFISPGGGGVYQGNNSSSWSTTSDRRLKKNIVDNNSGLKKLTQIQVRNFEYRLPEEVDAELKPHDAIIKTGVQLGVIAQELQAVLPDCVKQETSGVLSVDPDNLTWYMVNAIKELNAKIEAQAAEIAILKGQA
jgi:hypothetical protein